MSTAIRTEQYPPLATSGFPRQVSFQQDGGCLRPGGPRPMAANSARPVDVLPELVFGGRILANPPGWDKPYQLRLTELHDAATEGPSPMPNTDWTAGDEPHVWPQSKPKKFLEVGQIDSWRVPWWSPGWPDILYYQRPRVIQEEGRVWALPAVLQIPTAAGGVLEYPMTYSPSRPAWLLEPTSTKNIYLEQLAYWESGIGPIFGDWFAVWVARSWWGQVQQPDVGYSTAGISQTKSDTEGVLLAALKALAIGMGLSPSADTVEGWKSWFHTVFATLTLVLDDSPELAAFHAAFPPPGGAPLHKAAIQMGHRPALIRLEPGVPMPLSLAHPVPCGMCPVSQSVEEAKDPGRVLIGGDVWGVGTGLTFKQQAYSTVTDGGVVTKTDAEGNVTVDGVLQVPGGGLPPEPGKSGIGTGLLALGALAAGLLLLRRG